MVPTTTASGDAHCALVDDPAWIAGGAALALVPFSPTVIPPATAPASSPRRLKSAIVSSPNRHSDGVHENSEVTQGSTSKLLYAAIQVALLEVYREGPACDSDMHKWLLTCAPTPN
ncbi:hypothetical protein TPA0908_54460 [Micromonospora sp. AKA38]|nr:hypothetical protein TPA0908_54460 [Micromonospora sp. AKA38]